MRGPAWCDQARNAKAKIMILTAAIEAATTRNGIRIGWGRAYEPTEPANKRSSVTVRIAAVTVISRDARSELSACVSSPFRRPKIEMAACAIRGGMGKNRAAKAMSTRERESLVDEEQRVEHQRGIVRDARQHRMGT